ncbi:1-aminocyclopropane-1-carboxylate deaminase/D-cysteine desulfhydrase [Gilvimarinus chinensis]|uniref:1-aminocyclopropane-1-carboxylate deaminase/D-cysteine desulfhydrase n=1 Tax=Gilvimarinus chinensis TaxID=396005 RepID=UPI00036B5A14|nr:pyridoxal-phosphate dependent enzyme [Gilvimarinus chinensis]
MGKYEPETELLQRALQVSYDPLVLPNCAKAGVKVVLRRDDLIDPYCSGNKFYKLFYNLLNAKQLGAKRLTTAGGAWSNHIYAVALAARKIGLPCRGLIRGERPRVLSPTLLDASRAGMQLEFISRANYRQSAVFGPADLPEEDYFIPEGGANSAGERGAAVLGQAIAATVPTSKNSYVCMAVGTGGTLKGVVSALPASVTAIGISVLKDNSGSSAIGSSMCEGRWRLLWGFAAGGYARRLPTYLLEFWKRFELSHAIALDPVYTLKALYAVDNLAARGYWPAGSQVVVIHSGGLQGRRGFRSQIDWPEPSFSHCF